MQQFQWSLILTNWAESKPLPIPRAVNFWELHGVRNQRMSILRPSNCAVLTSRKSDKKKKKRLCVLFFSFFNLRTFVCWRFCMLRSFSGRDVHDVGDLICLVREREKPCPGGRPPLNAGESTALLYHVSSLDFSEALYLCTRQYC